MAWWPYALAHRLNPFITYAVWAPIGCNLTWVASIPAVSFAFAPVTVLFGPVASYNCAALLAPAISAWAAFLLCDRVVRHTQGRAVFSAAFVGGIVYGFSPCEIRHVLGGHLNLTWVAVPPLCTLIVLALLDGTVSRRLFVAGFTALLVIQCLISTEILATMTLLGAAGSLVSAGLIPVGQKQHIGRVVVLVGLAYLIAAGILAPFLYYAFATGAVPREPPFASHLLSADVLSLTVPPVNRLLHTVGSARLAEKFAGNPWENAYMGVPLLALGCWYFLKHRHEPLSRLLAVMLLVILLLEVGPVVQVAGRPIMPMLWAVLEKLPLITDAMPLRLANYAFLVAAIVLGLSLAQPNLHFRRPVALAVLLTLFPNPRQLFSKSVYQNPPFFARGLYRSYLRPADNVLVLPYGVNGPSMQWQAESSMYFRMPEGYLGPTPEAFLRWPLVNLMLTSIPVPEAEQQLNAFAAAYKIDAIIVTDNATAVVRDLPKLLGRAPLRVGGVSLYRVLPKIDDDRQVDTKYQSDRIGYSATSYYARSRVEPTQRRGGEEHDGSLWPGSVIDALKITRVGERISEENDIGRFQQSAALDWLSLLACAASRFLASGEPLSRLNASAAWKRDWLPYSKWDGNSLDLVSARFEHGDSNGLWLGPVADGSVAVGMFVSPQAARTLYLHYAAAVNRFFYPYPQRYFEGAQAARGAAGSSDFLLLTVRPSVLNRLCSRSSEGSVLEMAPNGIVAGYSGK